MQVGPQNKRGSMPPDDPADHPLFQRRIRPHRSMSAAQVRVMLVFVAIGGIVTSLPFVLIGAWPVAGFFGLDVLMVYLAFRASFSSARAYEDIRVTALDLSLRKVSPRGITREWRFNPVWVRLDRHEHPDFGTQRIELIARGDRVEVAGFLGPDAKAEFADGLGAALGRARRGVRYS
ncbi:DUF2244 domain-containing protein [Lichenihabitans sp. Uapishka_5]|uniref:DUF2244 domain-containing protein n=1 Tax=Lichenihabitans sp. Uapishka_5 TaxID=3037302 RepID=UPI0029E7D207|nr:DUF2244 domain-containing protein [Lichenihabitans sp. Uapishka_5]MDX7954060.1 DUF2244 domain-containing protein [Lichenihabitans sp. Uapishka_5]